MPLPSGKKEKAISYDIMKILVLIYKKNSCHLIFIVNSFKDNKYNEK